MTLEVLEYQQWKEESDLWLENTVCRPWSLAKGVPWAIGNPFILRWINNNDSRGILLPASVIII